jgi:hypothetical protein
MYRLWYLLFEFWDFFCDLLFEIWYFTWYVVEHGC